jgi:hypothetical protein
MGRLSLKNSEGLSATFSNALPGDNTLPEKMEMLYVSSLKAFLVGDLFFSFAASIELLIYKYQIKFQ